MTQHTHLPVVRLYASMSYGTSMQQKHHVLLEDNQATNSKSHVLAWA